MNFEELNNRRIEVLTSPKSENLIRQILHLLGLEGKIIKSTGRTITYIDIDEAFSIHSSMESTKLGRGDLWNFYYLIYIFDMETKETLALVKYHLAGEVNLGFYKFEGEVHTIEEEASKKIISEQDARYFITQGDWHKMIGVEYTKAVKEFEKSTIDLNAIAKRDLEKKLNPKSKLVSIFR